MAVVPLNSILDAASAKGFYGSLELAAGVLRVSGRFVVEKEPAGKWHAVRRSTALVPIEPRPTALVAVAGNRLESVLEGWAG